MWTEDYEGAWVGEVCGVFGGEAEEGEGEEKRDYEDGSGILDCLDYLRDLECDAMIQPKGEMVLIEPVEPAETYDAGGLLAIPDRERLRPNEAIVIAVGEGRRRRKGVRVPLDVKVGDRIVFEHYGAKDVSKVDQKNESLMIVKESGIMAILEEEGGEREC